MTDAQLVAKKLAFIETCLRELREMAKPETLADDIREQRFVEHTLQISIQAALDVASHIVSDDRLGEPSTNRELVAHLTRAGWIAPEIGEALGDMAGFRNLLVHGYADVDVGVLAEILANDLTDLDAYVASIRTRLDA